MKIACWNVNSLKVRLPHVLDWLAANAGRCALPAGNQDRGQGFPFAELSAAGYHALHNGQKTYNGVAILSRTPAEDVRFDIPGFADEQKRVLAATIGGVRIVCAYMPNGQAVGSDKYDYKLRWLAALQAMLREDLRHLAEACAAG
jgi:exodeoxyribonuclease-3